MKKDRYQAYFERSADAILITVDDSIVDCNSSALKLLGYENKQALLNINLFDLFSDHQADGSSTSNNLNQLLLKARADGSQNFEWQCRKSDNEIIPVELSITSLEDDENKYLHLTIRDISRQKVAERDKHEVENKIRAIFNHRFQLTGLLAADGNLLMANQTACDMVGAECDELEGKYLWELPHWSHSVELQNKIHGAVQSAQKGEIVNFETTHIDTKGDIHYIDFSLTPVPNEEGEVIYIVPEGHDITVKKQAEKKLVESERNYREIYNSSGDAIFIHDASTGKIIDVNQTMLEMYGYSYDEALQLGIADVSALGPEFTQKAAIEKVKKAVNDGPQLFEWYAKRKDGACFWVEVALRNTTIGGKGRVLAVVRDITERKLLDSELRLVKYSIEHSAFPFEWIQKDSRFIYVNDATCRSLGYSREQLCSMKVSDIDPDYTDQTWPEFWDRLKSEKSLTFETNHIKKNGEIFPVEITANHVEFEGQEHVFAYVQDIRDRIEYEKKQKQLQNKLQQAQKMEAIGTLAGGIAHDFNNILSSIFGYTELAQISSNDSKKLEKYLDQIYSGAKRAKDLVQQILTFSRSSEQELKALKVQLVVKEALKLLRSSIPSTISIEEDIDLSCEPVLADPTQVHQIVMNLCTNAYHAMRDSGGVLTVSLKPVDLTSNNISHNLNHSNNTYLVMKISDNGRGIPRDILDRIFDPYFTTKPKGEGTGLGLAMVHGIINNFGGNVFVESEIGAGTIFYVYFPVVEQTVNNQKNKISVSLPTGNEHILFVDDDNSVVQVSRILLESLGYTVTAMTKSPMALDMFQKTPNDFDLVITDATMPGITGIDLARHILHIRPNMPIILCTGFSEQINTEQTEEMGVKEVLMKPITRVDMANTIRKVLD